MDPLKYLSEKTADALYLGVEQNLPRYLGGSFSDQAESADWSILLPGVTVDLPLLAQLDPSGTPASEAANSMLLWNALSGMTASLANQNRIWTRLTHVECLDYARRRWLKNPEKKDVRKAVETHFFADTRTRCRDDNAISRLWWNSQIARRISPTDPASVLAQILKTADIRLSFVERPWIATRVCVAAGIVRLMVRMPEITEGEYRFRALMKAINLVGAGMVFEAMDETAIDSLLDSCAARALGNWPPSVPM